MLGAIISVILFLLVGGFVVQLLGGELDTSTVGLVFTVIIGIVVVRYIF